MMPKQTTNLLRQIGIVGAVVATIVVNSLANTLPFNDVTTGEVAARFDVLFKPAGYAFSIWGLIYAGLTVYAIYQAQPSLRGDKRLRSIDLPVVISAAANVSWLLAWHYGYIVASFVVMLVLLGSLIAIYHRLEPEREIVSTTRRWAVHHPFSVYLGWVTVASLANLAGMLDFLGWTGLGVSDLVWFTITVAVVLLVAVLITSRRGDVPYLLTLTWAFIALGIAHQMSPLVAAVAWIGTAALAVMVALAAVRQAPNRPALYDL